jgi:hypothetical protein
MEWNVKTFRKKKEEEIKMVLCFYNTDLLAGCHLSPSGDFFILLSPFLPSPRQPHRPITDQFSNQSSNSVVDSNH